MGATLGTATDSCSLVDQKGLPLETESVPSKEADDGEQMSTSIIHAYNSPGPQTAQDQDQTGESSDLQDGWRNKASNLLCCFSSAGYYLEQTRSRIGQQWAPGTGELRVFANRLSRTSLLGEPSAENSGRVTLVLDLDETLVHSSFTPIENADFVASITVEGTAMTVYIIKRPWLDYFLQQVAAVFEVVVFTASLEQYANVVLDHIDPLHTLSARLFRDSCVAHNGSYVKDLSRLGRPLTRTLLLDNSPASYSFQPDNGFLSATFLDDASDTGLLDILDVLLRIRDAPDVRAALPTAVAAVGYVVPDETL